MRISRCLSIIALVVLISGCEGDDRTITLEAALARIKQGEYSLIVLSDDIVSFQKDGIHKYQLISTPPLSEQVASKIREAAQQAKPPIQVWDARAPKGAAL